LEGIGKVVGKTSLPWVIGPRSDEFKQFDSKALKVFEGEVKWSQDELHKVIAALWMMTRG
jgi:hypothetical protein